MKIENKAGDKYGMLTLVSFEYKNKNSHQFWLCKCDCGGEKIAHIGSVKNGGTNSCGCINKKPQHTDLSGQKFNMLEILNYEYNKDKKAYFKCKCDCGNEVIKQGKEVKSGHTKSCSCLNTTPRFEDRSGSIFGSIKVVSFNKKEKSNYLYNCKCDCGNEKVIRISDLVQGRVKSCGCMTREDDLKEGDRYNKLTVVKRVEDERNGKFFECTCDCGNTVTIRQSSIKKGLTRSRGCMSKGSNTQGTIYGIYDNEGILKYVGQTVQYKLENRLGCHIRNPSNPKMKEWLDSLNYRPEIKTILENVPIMDLNSEEERIIKEHREKFSLLNIVHN